MHSRRRMCRRCPGGGRRALSERRHVQRGRSRGRRRKHERRLAPRLSCERHGRRPLEPLRRRV